MKKQTLWSVLPALCLASSAFAQSAGGGLGGDKRVVFDPRQNVIKPVQINFLNKTCNSLQTSVQKNQVIRLNFPSDIASVYAIVGSTRKVTFCHNANWIRPYQTDTVDQDNCSLGFVCDPTSDRMRGNR